jgi:hypothetical protein
MYDFDRNFPDGNACLNWGYEHKCIPHAERVYVVGNVHTNTIEGFWSLLKRGIGGAYHSVFAKHLNDYVNEYAFRNNHRDDPAVMFGAVTVRWFARHLPWAPTRRPAERLGRR